MMKKYESISFWAYMGLQHYCGKLATYSDDLDGIKRSIDRADANAVSLGYESRTYLITRMETYTYYDDDNTFVKRETYENAVEVYHPKRETE